MLKFSGFNSRVWGKNDCSSEYSDFFTCLPIYDRGIMLYVCMLTEDCLSVFILILEQIFLRLKILLKVKTSFACTVCYRIDYTVLLYTFETCQVFLLTGGQANYLWYSRILSHPFVLAQNVLNNLNVSLKGNVKVNSLIWHNQGSQIPNSVAAEKALKS